LYVFFAAKTCLSGRCPAKVISSGSDIMRPGVMSHFSLFKAAHIEQPTGVLPFPFLFSEGAWL
jgi:hypothetical protein